jgi:hypothetical protein|tara:strand:- start:232 stop:543 length:312 start_codon:yes stop_codon:yes gene_type:complete
MKKVINPFTGKEDYKMNYKEVAEHLGMTLSNLHYRYSNNCRLNQEFLPKRRAEYGKWIFYLSEVEHFKKHNRFAVPKPKIDAEKSSNNSKDIKEAKVIKFSKE